jgi:hypothetical protein
MTHEQRRGTSRRGRARRGSLPDGPYTGQDAERALKAKGYVCPVEARDDTFAVYVHPDTGDTVPVNPEWEFCYGDAQFNCLCRDMRVSRRTLRGLLSRHPE